MSSQKTTTYIPPHLRKVKDESKTISVNKRGRSYIGIVYVKDIGDVHLHIKYKKKDIETANIRVASIISGDADILRQIALNKKSQHFNSYEPHILKWICVSGLTYRKMAAQLPLSDNTMFQYKSKLWETNTKYTLDDTDNGFLKVKGDSDLYDLPSSIKLTNYHFMDDGFISLCRKYTNGDKLSSSESNYLKSNIPLDKYYVLPGYYNKKCDKYDYQLMVTGSLKIIKNFGGLTVESLLDGIQREIKEEVGFDRYSYCLTKFNSYGSSNNIIEFKNRYGNNYFYTPCFHACIKC